jgi:hypothetical protein
VTATHIDMPKQALSEEAAQLKLVITRIHERVNSRLSFADERVDSGAATLALMRIMLSHGKALVAVSSQHFAETGSSHVRAMFEAWIDIYAILEPGKEEENARRCVVFGLLEFRDHSIAVGTLSATDLAHIEDALQEQAHE